MKFPERWHKWPEETPPENEPLQVEVWNPFLEKYELAVGIFRKGEFFHYDSGESSQYLFNHVLEEVFWRLWEDEEDN